MSLDGPILIIEDDIHDADTVEIAVRELGIPNPVVTCGGAREAYDFLLKTDSHPLVILCDIRLPEMDGLTFRRNILNEPSLHKKSIPFVFFTGLLSQQLVDEAYKLDVQGFFEKPRNYQELKDCLLVILLYWRRSFHPNRRMMA